MEAGGALPAAAAAAPTMPTIPRPFSPCPSEPDDRVDSVDGAGSDTSQPRDHKGQPRLRLSTADGGPVVVHRRVEAEAWLFSPDLFFFMLPFLSDRQIVSMRRVCRHSERLFRWCFLRFVQARVTPLRGDWLPRVPHTLASDPTDLLRRRARTVDTGGPPPLPNDPPHHDQLMAATAATAPTGERQPPPQQRRAVSTLRLLANRIASGTVASLQLIEAQWRRIRRRAGFALGREASRRAEEGEGHLFPAVEGSIWIQADVAPAAPDASEMRVENTNAAAGSITTQRAPEDGGSSREGGPGGNSTINPLSPAAAAAAGDAVPPTVTTRAASISSLVGMTGAATEQQAVQTNRCGRRVEEEVRATLTEATQASLVQFNVGHGLCEIVDSPVASHLPPVVLPNGTVLFAVGHEIHAELRTYAGHAAPTDNGNSDVDAFRDAAGTTWVRTVRNRSHNDLVTAMQYHAATGVVLTASRDGHIRTWRLPSTTRLPRAEVADQEPAYVGLPESYAGLTWRYPEDTSHVRHHADPMMPPHLQWMLCIKAQDNALARPVDGIDVVDVEDIVGRRSPNVFLVAWYIDGSVSLFSCGGSRPTVGVDGAGNNNNNPSWSNGWTLVGRYEMQEPVITCRLLNHVPFPSCHPTKAAAAGAAPLSAPVERRRGSEVDDGSEEEGDGAAEEPGENATADGGVVGRPDDGVPPPSVTQDGEVHVLVSTLTKIVVLTFPVCRVTSFHVVPSHITDVADDPSDLPGTEERPIPPPPWIVREGLSDKIVSTLLPQRDDDNDDKAADASRVAIVEHYADQAELLSQRRGRLRGEPRVQVLSTLEEHTTRALFYRGAAVPPICHSSYVSDRWPDDGVVGAANATRPSLPQGLGRSSDWNASRPLSTPHVQPPWETITNAATTTTTSPAVGTNSCPLASSSWGEGGNTYLTNPCAGVCCDRGFLLIAQIPPPPARPAWQQESAAAGAATDNLDSPPRPGPGDYASFRIVFDKEVTCCAVSPTRPMFVVGLHNGVVKALVSLPPSSGERRATDEMLPFLGARLDRDLQRAYQNESRSPSTGLRVATLRPAHVAPVLSVHVDSHVIISLDRTTTAHCFSALDRQILWCLSPRCRPFRPIEYPWQLSNGLREWLTSRAARRRLCSDITFVNGVMALGPVCGHGGTIIVDFNGEYIDDAAAADLRRGQPLFSAALTTPGLMQLATIFAASKRNGGAGTAASCCLGGGDAFRVIPIPHPIGGEISLPFPANRVPASFRPGAVSVQLCSMSTQRRRPPSPSSEPGLGEAPPPAAGGAEVAAERRDQADGANFAEDLTASLNVSATTAAAVLVAGQLQVQPVLCLHAKINVSLQEALKACERPVSAAAIACFALGASLHADALADMTSTLRYLCLPLFLLAWLLGTVMHVFQLSCWRARSSVPLNLCLRQLAWTLRMWLFPWCVTMRLAPVYDDDDVGNGRGGRSGWGPLEASACFQCLSWTLITAPLALAFVVDALVSQLEHRVDAFRRWSLVDLWQLRRGWSLTLGLCVVLTSACFDAPSLPYCVAGGGTAAMTNTTSTTTAAAFLMANSTTTAATTTIPKRQNRTTAAPEIKPAISALFPAPRLHYSALGAPPRITAACQVVAYSTGTVISPVATVLILITVAEIVAYRLVTQCSSMLLTSVIPWCCNGANWRWGSTCLNTSFAAFVVFLPVLLLMFKYDDFDDHVKAAALGRSVPLSSVDELNLVPLVAILGPAIGCGIAFVAVSGVKAVRMLAHLGHR